MQMRLIRIVLVMVIGSAGLAWAEGPRVLFFSKSAGFEHSVIKVTNDEPSHVEKVIRPLIEEAGGSLVASKDGAWLTAEKLAEFDVVVFYTTGDLCSKEPNDGTPPADENSMMALLDWIRTGGGFVGIHCASDTWHRHDNQYAPESPFLDALGGQFRGHGAQFVGNLRVVDADHPTMAAIADGWEINDEWYLFRMLMHEDMHVLALLDPADEREKQEKYQVPSYPIIWCSAPGEGRIFYNAMGHREDVWTNPKFQQHFMDSLHWANGAGPADAEPNWKETVPAELDPETGAARE